MLSTVVLLFVVKEMMKAEKVYVVDGGAGCGGGDDRGR